MLNFAIIWLGLPADLAAFLGVLMRFGMPSPYLFLPGMLANSTNASIQPTLLMFKISCLSLFSHSRNMTSLTILRDYGKLVALA